MNPRARRYFITFAIVLVALLILFGPLLLQPRGGEDDGPGDALTDARQDDSAPATPTDPQPTGQPDTPGGDAPAARGQDNTRDDPRDDPQPPQLTSPSGTMSAHAPERALSEDNPPQALGSLDWRQARIRIEFTPYAAGVRSIAMSDIWETAAARREATAIQRRIEAGEATLDELPSDQHYVIQSARDYGGVILPALAAHSIQIDGQRISLFGNVWSEGRRPGHFVTEIRDEDGTPIVRMEREYQLRAMQYDFALVQRIVNLTSRQLDVQLIFYGPLDLFADRSRYIDRRTFRFGHLLSQENDPDRLYVNAHTDVLFERTAVTRMVDRNLQNQMRGIAERELLWPNEGSERRDFEISWFAAQNRYFAMALHALPTDDGRIRRSLASVIDRIIPNMQGDLLALEVLTPTHTVAPEATLDLSLGVYAGPLDRQVLAGEEPFSTLNMRLMIVYQMSTWCAICTFQWLARLLLVFLSFVHGFTGDWGVAIIFLVVVVRLLLHPLTKRVQINMTLFGRRMQALKPEMDKVMKKYANDKKKQQQEQMRLMRESGLNPLQALGCLPMFLQMPIWIALYAMLYLAFELRHEPAFWGIFQIFGNWAFLSDLSSGDHFFYEFAEPTRVLLWNLTGVNLLPLLMGFVFYFQQKYLAPPPSPNMTPEQVQTQKIMKIMLVFGMPLILYSAPSGLTLYILTSSCWSIVEGKYIRNHVDELVKDPDLLKKPAKRTPAAGKGKTARDPQSRAFQAAMERTRERLEEKKKRKNAKRFKKRD